MASRTRSYSQAFLNYGFVNLPSKGKARPQCVICCKVLINESLKSSKLSGHLSKCHSEHAHQDRAYFERKAKQLKGIQFGRTGNVAENLVNCVEASYIVALKIAKQQKSHTIAETLCRAVCKGYGFQSFGRRSC